MEESINIFAACMNGNVEVVQQLIADGFNVNEPQFTTKCTPLHLASISGKRRVLKLLLKSDALIDAKDVNGRTALHHAAERQTPLALAAYKGRSELVQMLLDRNADPDVFDDRGRRALHAAVVGEHKDCADTLLRAGSSQICLIYLTLIGGARSRSN